MKSSKKSFYNLLYRVRSKGFKVDRKARLIFISHNRQDEARKQKTLNRLVNEFGFERQTEF